jgi:predicted metal-binding membrane protein
MFAVSDRIKAAPAAAPVAAAALGGLAAAAWVALAAGVGGHTSHDEVLGHGSGLGHASHPATFAALFGGWLLMVAAMMLPPEIASAGWVGSPVARRGWAAAGAVAAKVAGTTCAVWMGFAVVALSGDALVHALVDSSPWLTGLVAPAVLVGAGAFQLTPAKQRLLAEVRLGYSDRTTSSDRTDTGVHPNGRNTERPVGHPSWRHALRCVGSCWALMLVMFAVGMGNLVWMAVLTALMIAERAVRPALAPWLTTLAGVALIITGLQTTVHHHIM